LFKFKNILYLYIFLINSFKMWSDDINDKYVFDLVLVISSTIAIFITNCFILYNNIFLCIGNNNLLIYELSKGIDIIQLEFKLYIKNIPLSSPQTYIMFNDDLFSGNLQSNNWRGSTGKKFDSIDKYINAVQNKFNEVSSINKSNYIIYYNRKSTNFIFVDKEINLNLINDLKLLKIKNKLI